MSASRDDSLGRTKRALEDAYARAFGRPSLQRLNDFVLKLALRARGYGNYRSLRESGELAFLYRLAGQTPQLCVDVGANKGEYTKCLLEVSQSMVIAFEPLPVAFRELAQLRHRFGARLDCVNKGVADKSGTLELQFGSEDSPHASFSAEVNDIGYVGRTNINRRSVEVTTLDEYLEARFPGGPPSIDLIKVDTEGYELEVLAGAQRTIERCRPRYIQLEFNLHQMFRGCSLLQISRLMPGYRAYQLLPYEGGLSVRDLKSPLSNIYHFSNFVFVREDVEI